MDVVLDVQRTSKSFGRACILNGINLTIKRGEMVGLIGASGSGKSTLIRTIAGLTPIDPNKQRGNRKPSDKNPVEKNDALESAILLFGQPIQQNGRIARTAKILRVRVGVIFQQFNLVPRLTVLTNVCLGALGRLTLLQAAFGHFTRTERQRAMRALTRVGIAEHALKRGCDLSGGQQQRAAIARTLVQGAEFIVADEPIASLDPSSARRVMDILADLNRRDNITVLVSLHQVEYAMKYCPRTIALKAGQIVYDGPTRALTTEFLTGIYGAESRDLFASLEREHRVETNHAGVNGYTNGVSGNVNAHGNGTSLPTTDVTASQQLAPADSTLNS
jgi:phosphonate transport system ATP-binding protein